MKNRKGFTIVELVIVIAVIAILAAVLIPTFSGVVGKANDSARTQAFTNALKVVIAGNAETGGLAAGTVFISDDGYYAIYNGNKLLDITPIDDSDKPFALGTVSGGNSTTYTIASADYKVPGETNAVSIRSVILPSDDGVYDADSLKFLAKLGGGDGATAATLGSGNVTVKDGLTLYTFPNVDLPSGFIVLSPSTSK